MGSEFIPSLDEGDIALHAMRIPGTSLTQALSMQNQLEEKIKTLPEVSHVFAKIGTADIATDPMLLSQHDIYLPLRPRSEWKAAKTKAELVEKMEAEVANIPGMKVSFTQPIEMRMNEMSEGVGVRSEIGGSAPRFRSAATYARTNANWLAIPGISESRPNASWIVRAM